MPPIKERIQVSALSDAACPLCNISPQEVVCSNGLALAFRDGYPVTEGHTLIVSVRHVASWFEANTEEQRAIFDLLEQAKGELDAELSPDGYNVGFNQGQAAGQTVGHLHVHLIPRHTGDVDDPTGGVRLVIPERGNYRAEGRIPRATGQRPPWHGDLETP